MNNPKLDNDTQLCIAGYLLELNNLDARARIEKALVNPDEAESAVKVIGYHTRSDENAWGNKLILDALKNNRLDHFAARTACEGLGARKLKSAVPVLLEMLRSRQKSSMAGTALCKIGTPEALSAVVENMKGEVTLCYDEVIELLDRKQPGLSAILVRHLGDEYPSVNLGYSGLAYYLEKLDDTSVIPALREFISKHPNDHRGVWANVVLSRLERETPAQFAARIAPLAEQANVTSFFGQLGKTGDDVVVAPIARMLKKSTNKYELCGGVEALELVPSPKATQALVELLDRDDQWKDWHKRATPEIIKLRDFVVKALKAKTKQDFGNDVAKWKEWVKVTYPQ